jgi:hypothetical protein
VQRSFDFRDELFGPSAQNHGGCLCFRATFKDIEALSADLPLFELVAGSKVLCADIRGGRLRLSSYSLHDSLQIVVRDSPSTEDIAVCEVLCCQISDR